MKIIKTANGNEIKISKSEWKSIGKTAGWITASSKRAVVMNAMKMLLGQDAFISTSEEFGINKGGIWFSNEGNGVDDMPLYDSEGMTEYMYDVHPKLKQLMDQQGWFVEPYDNGTLMAWEA